VNEFVAECRREWKRLGVPDAVAEEMAADLAADLEEAAAEGVSAEAVLGSGAFDPRSFAAEWAAARGVVVRTPRRPSRLRAARVPAAAAACALVAIVGAVLLLRTSSAPERFAGGTEGIPLPRMSLPARVELSPPENPTVWVSSGVREDARDSTSRTAGTVLLIAGLAGALVLTTLAASRDVPGPVR
jgi:hypothetical protein